MTGPYVSRRRADEFDALLSAPTRELDSAAAYVDLLELVGSLRALPPVTARSEFVSDLRSQLVVAAARQARPVVDDELRLRLTPRQRYGTRERRAATLLGGFAIVAASGSMAMASQSALPGDVLYPVKRAIENAETNLQSDDAAKAQTLIAHAETRLQEAQQLTAQDADASTVAATLQDFTEQSNQAADLALDDYAATGDRALIGELRSFAEDSMDDLDELGDVVPSEARPALITAAQSVLQADTAAFQVCPTCGDGAVTELPAFATEPAALTTDLGDILSLKRTIDSVTLPPDLSEIEDIAEEESGKTRRNESQDSGSDNGADVGNATPPPIPGPGTDTPPDIDNPPSNPIDDLGDRTKDDLGGNPDDLDQTADTVGDVVDDVSGTVDGILGD